MNFDWHTCIRIGHSADQISDAVEHISPQCVRQGFSLLHIYDLRGVVDEVPALAVVCSTSSFHTGVAKQPPGSLYTHVILFPNFFFRSINKALIQSQTLLHHELAHIILGHDVDENYALKKSSAYFNHPAELDAYFHQALAGVARDQGYDSWVRGNISVLLGDRPDQFADKFQRVLLPKFWSALNPINREFLINRAIAFWTAGNEALEKISPANLESCDRVSIHKLEKLET